MLRLRTFGGLSIERAAGTSPSVSATTARRRMALLAVLAASGSRGVPRDKLLVLFWPESDSDRARHALDQSLYALKRELGTDALFVGREELSLNPDVITSDIGDFRDALLQGKYASAVELNAGIFLDGVYVSAAPDFERWVDDERAQLTREVESALERLATEATARGDHARAAQWWQRLATRDPRKTRVVMALMSELAASGDRNSALRHADIYHTLVREDPDLEPNPAVAALAEKLKREPAPAPRAAAVRAVAPSEQPQLQLSPTAVHAGRRSSAHGYRALAVLAAVTAVGLSVAWMLAARGRATDRAWILPAELENRTGDSVFDRALDAAVAVGLQQSTIVNILPRSRVQQMLKLMGRADTLRLDENLAREVAQRAGVSAVVAGDINRVDSSYIVTLRLVDAVTGVALAADSRTARRRGDVIDAVDDLLRHLRRGIGESAIVLAKHDRPLPQATTRSLEALHKYAAGNRAYHTGRRNAAIELWRQAVALDSDFALAHEQLGAAAYFANDRPAGEAHYARALALLGRLTDREQLMVRASVESWRGNRERAIELRRTLLDQYPNDPDAWGIIGYDYMRLERNREAIDALRRQIARDTANAIAYVNLGGAYADMEDYVESLRSYRRAFVLQPAFFTLDNVNNEYGRVLVLAGRFVEARAAYDTMVHGGMGQRAYGERSIGMLLMLQGRYGEAIDHLRQATLVSHARGAALTEARNHLFLAAAEQEKGWPDSARAELHAAHALFRGAYMEPAFLMFLGKALVRDGELSRAAEVRDSLRRRVQNQMDTANLAVLDGEIALAQGRTDSALRAMKQAYAVDSSAYVGESLARALAAGGDLAGAARAYESLASSIRRWYGWEAEQFGLTAPLAAAAIYERMGDGARARSASQRLITQWAGGDSDLTSLRQARDRLKRLP